MDATAAAYPAATAIGVATTFQIGGSGTDFAAACPTSPASFGRIQIRQRFVKHRIADEMALIVNFRHHCRRRENGQTPRRFFALNAPEGLRFGRLRCRLVDFQTGTDRNRRNRWFLLRRRRRRSLVLRLTLLLTE